MEFENYNYLASDLADEIKEKLVACGIVDTERNCSNVSSSNYVCALKLDADGDIIDQYEIRVSDHAPARGVNLEINLVPGKYQTADLHLRTCERFYRSVPAELDVFRRDPDEYDGPYENVECNAEGYAFDGSEHAWESEFGGDLTGIDFDAIIVDQENWNKIVSAAVKLACDALEHDNSSLPEIA